MTPAGDTTKSVPPLMVEWQASSEAVMVPLPLISVTVPATASITTFFTLSGKEGPDGTSNIWLYLPLRTAAQLLNAGSPSKFAGSDAMSVVEVPPPSAQP